MGDMLSSRRERVGVRARDDSTKNLSEYSGFSLFFERIQNKNLIRKKSII